MKTPEFKAFENLDESYREDLSQHAQEFVKKELEPYHPKVNHGVIMILLYTHTKYRKN